MLLAESEVFTDRLPPNGGRTIKKLAVNEKFLNGGTALVLMGALWLYLWVFPWYGSYVAYPQWGHNYAEAAAFLAVGLAYFNRRLITCVLAFLAASIIIPTSLELLPHPVTASINGALLVLIIIDMLIERKRQHDLLLPPNKPLGFWLKKHLPRFSYIMLAHMALLYFLVRLPIGTYETDIVTKVYDGMLFPFVILLLLEEMPGMFNGALARRLSYFWGMAAMIASLALLWNQPATWPTMAVTLIFTLAGILALVFRTKTTAK
jgi:hypothetical protein